MRKARLDDLGQINALFLEMREALLKEAADGAEKIGRLHLAEALSYRALAEDARHVAA